ncbi:unnamed protein product [Larinioides sclopetarius]|uniref:Uncharacterized protein n=1 Tax=Larinioides sclopetarius TaxID=280406 RepID=A0AAV2A946_9ARAC
MFTIRNLELLETLNNCFWNCQMTILQSNLLEMHKMKADIVLPEDTP